MSRDKTDQLLGSIAEVADVASLMDTRLGALVYDQAMNLASTENDLYRAAGQLAEKMGKLRRHIEGEIHINGLGEVQQLGNDIDRLCALRQEQLATLKKTAATYHKTRSSGHPVDTAK